MTESRVSWKEAFLTWVRVAALSFGGPAGQIAVMHRILVEEKRWIGETRFLHALSYCMLLPGPEAHELAIYVGWLMHRIRGGVLAGVLFVLPGFVTVGALSWAYAVFGQVGFVQGLFLGLKAAVFAVVLQGVVRVGGRALRNPASVAIAAGAFLALFVFALPFPLVVLAAGAIGFAGNRIKPEWFAVAAHASAKKDTSPALIDEEFARGAPAHVRPSFARFATIALIGGAIWLAPLALLVALRGPQDVFAEISGFNAKMAVVTFGGAYAVLAYMAQQAVGRYHWLKPDEMLVGLGFAETTPGPLICVVQFVGFMAAFRQPGSLDPTFAGFAGGALAMWSTFVPPFIWIFLGGPYIEALIGNKALNAALSAVTAAVVGVILNLAIWFALHTLFARTIEIRSFGLMLDVPLLASVNWEALLIAVAAAIAMFRFKAGMPATLAASSLAGVAFYFIG